MDGTAASIPNSLTSPSEKTSVSSPAWLDPVDHFQPRPGSTTHGPPGESQSGARHRRRRRRRRHRRGRHSCILRRRLRVQAHRRGHGEPEPEVRDRGGARHRRLVGSSGAGGQGVRGTDDRARVRDQGRALRHRGRGNDVRAPRRAGHQAHPVAYVLRADAERRGARASGDTVGGDAEDGVGRERGGARAAARSRGRRGGGDVAREE